MTHQSEARIKMFRYENGQSVKSKNKINERRGCTHTPGMRV